MVSELARHQGEFDKAVPSSSASGASAFAPITVRADDPVNKDDKDCLAPAVCNNNIKFVPHAIDVEDVGVKKPLTGEKLITARIRAYKDGNLDAARSIDDQMKFCAAKSRSRRHRAKACKRALREYIEGRVPDPTSGDDI